VIDEDFLTLYVDPGETTGWALGKGLMLLASGQTPMWEFADEVELALDDRPTESLLFDDANWRGQDPQDYMHLPFGRIVCEDWRLYPDKLHALAWDQCRTARLIGALTDKARRYRLPFVLQPAAIKDRAVKGAAEELFVVPLHENRHQNDATMHFTYYTQTELMGLYYSGLESLPGKPDNE
jgi:hypothetical protein